MRLLLMLLAVVCAGCSSSRVQPVPMPPPPAPQPVVWIRGDVKNPAVLWNAQMTLARAIVAAEYKGIWNPHAITVIRQGQSYKINLRDLLQGLDDPPMEPGDTIVIER